MSREALVLLVCCCDFRDGAERLIPSKSLGNAVIRAFPGLLCILRMCAPRRAVAVVRPRGREKSADRRRRILISRLLIIRVSVPRRKSPFPAYFKGFPAVSPLIPPYPAFLKYPVSPQENSGLSYDKVLFELTEEQKDWELKIGTRVQIVCSDIFQESTPPIGNLISITEAAPNDELKIADEAARAYYENTVFEVVSLELKSQTENEISFSVCVSKGGIVQEPDRTIFLEFVNGHWEVVNEGY